KDFRAVRFSYRTMNPARSVAVAGDFNGWNPLAHPMEAEDSSRTAWSLVMPLREGRYRYKFVVDGSVWTHDPSAQSQELDPFGGFNSVVVVR
ncbi:MAG: isoamylase early set domain-containing protein, partial [Calditrichaeota bacterium]|nr:isoamylase early set domain-containing protein [Calditrichota bacterium]